MASREEIREGILGEIKSIIKAGTNLTKIAEAECITDQIFNYLHSQGVVLKVERELPELPYCYHHPDTINLNCFTCGDIVGQRNQRSNILRAGWEAVESLIKE